MAHFHDNALIGASGQGGYRIERSLRFNSADSAYLNRTPASAGNRRTWTWSGWVKRSALSSNQAVFSASDGTQSNEFLVYLGTGDTLAIQQTVGGTSSGQVSCFANAVYRDTSAWYHIVLAVDTTQATSTNRLLLYVNGVSQTFSSYSVGPSINTWVNNTNAHAIGKRADASLYFNGYLTEINFIDGQALTPSSFGETDTITGVWKPKRYSGSGYGTNGFYLNFSDNSGTTSTTLGKDSSGNGNNWTPNNFSVTAGAGNDSLIDTPTPYADGGNGRGNYCTFNALDNSGGITLSEGNLKAAWASASDRSILNTVAIPSSGKFYIELENGTLTSGSVAVAFGLATAASSRTSAGYATSNAWTYYASNQSYISRNGSLSSQIGSNQTIAAGGILQIAVDRTNNQAWLGYNNVWVNSTNGTTGDPGAGTNPTVSSLPADLFVFTGLYNNSANVNFGQRPFAYTPPSGFVALNTQNLPEPSIKKPSSYMDVVTYTGTGSALTPTSSLGFSPDLVWIKGRSGATDHALYDAVRGAEKRLESNNADAEVTSDGGVTAFNSAGFTLGTLAQVNTSSATYVAWCWDESATPGFDIVTFTAASSGNTTVSHSLGVAPNFILVKSRAVSGYNWAIYHSSIGNTGALIFSTNAVDTNSAWWNNTTPTSTQFVLGSNYAGGGSSVAYLWSEVAGFSKFGSYSGNSSTDGTFVWCGFKPRYLLIKGTGSGGSGWIILDSARDTYNAATKDLRADLANLEPVSSGAVDFLSNGFKLRNTDTNYNSSSTSYGPYVFAAFSENPFKYSLAR